MTRKDAEQQRGYVRGLRIRPPGDRVLQNAAWKAARWLGGPHTFDAKYVAHRRTPLRRCLHATRGAHHGIRALVALSIGKDEVNYCVEGHVAEGRHPGLRHEFGVRKAGPGLGSDRLNGFVEGQGTSAVHFGGLVEAVEGSEAARWSGQTRNRPRGTVAQLADHDPGLRLVRRLVRNARVSQIWLYIAQDLPRPPSELQFLAWRSHRERWVAGLASEPAALLPTQSYFRMRNPEDGCSSLLLAPRRAT